MAIDLFFRGLLIGLSIAAVVGPMSVLCIQRTVDRGHLYGLISGIGIATADAIYGSIAAFGLTAIATFLVNQQNWIRVIGGLFLIYIGIKAFLTPPAQQAANAAKTNTLFGAYVSTLFLTLTNPTTILSFAAIFAGLGIATGSRSYLSAMLIVCGVFSGSSIWWCVLTGGVNLLRGKFTPRWLLWINRISGAGITIFGAFVLLSLLS